MVSKIDNRLEQYTSAAQVSIALTVMKKSQITELFKKKKRKQRLSLSFYFHAMQNFLSAYF